MLPGRVPGGQGLVHRRQNHDRGHHPAPVKDEGQDRTRTIHHPGISGGHLHQKGCVAAEKGERRSAEKQRSAREDPGDQPCRHSLCTLRLGMSDQSERG